MGQERAETNKVMDRLYQRKLIRTQRMVSDDNYVNTVLCNAINGCVSYKLRSFKHIYFNFYLKKKD